MVAEVLSPPCEGSCEEIQNSWKKRRESTPPPMICKDLWRRWRPGALTGRIYSQLQVYKGKAKRGFRTLLPAVTRVASFSRVWISPLVVSTTKGQ